MIIIRILIVVFVMLFQSNILIAREPPKKDSEKVTILKTTNPPRIKSAAATACWAVGKSGYLFFYDPTKWTPHPYDDLPHMMKFISKNENIEAHVGYGTRYKFRKSNIDTLIYALKWKPENDKSPPTIVKIVSKEKCTINGTQFTIVRVDYTKKGLIKSFLQCFYEDAIGSLDASMNTTPDLLTQYAVEFEEFINGLITERLIDCKTVESRKAWLDKYKPLWTDADRQTVAEKKIKLGMTEDQAETAWGFPDSKNNTVSQQGKHTQWVYRPGMACLYFENGKLTAWQDSTQ